MQRFDALTHNLRECVLDMGSFSKDQKIIASTIIDVWSELHGKESIICMNYIQELASHNLLKLLPLGYVTFYSSVDSLSCYFSLFLIQESCESKILFDILRRKPYILSPNSKRGVLTPKFKSLNQ